MVNFDGDNDIARLFGGGLGAAGSLGSILGGLGLGSLIGSAHPLRYDEFLREQQLRAMQQGQLMEFGVLHQQAAFVVMTPIEELEAQLVRCGYEAWIMAGDRSTFQEWRCDHA